MCKKTSDLVEDGFPNLDCSIVIVNIGFERFGCVIDHVMFTGLFLDGYGDMGKMSQLFGIQLSSHVWSPGERYAL